MTEHHNEPPCPPDREALPTEPRSELGEEALAALARALGHPARVHILNTLISRQTCIAGELADELPLAASTVSQHLKVLKEAGWIKGQIDGARRCYCVDRAVLRQFRQLVAGL